MVNSRPSVGAVRRGPYQLKCRAARMDDTRLRITQAAVNLHQEIGPLAATVTAIADRAGVGRPTVYAHFPDEGFPCLESDGVADGGANTASWSARHGPALGKGILAAAHKCHKALTNALWRDSMIAQDAGSHHLDLGPVAI